MKRKQRNCLQKLTPKVDVVRDREPAPVQAGKDAEHQVVVADKEVGAEDKNQTSDVGNPSCDRSYHLKSDDRKKFRLLTSEFQFYYEYSNNKCTGY